MHEIPLNAVEAFENLISKILRKWLCVPLSLTDVALYSNSTKLRLPLKSIVEEFKAGKTSLVTMFEESKDPVVRNIQPDVKCGTKWRPSEEVASAKFAVAISNIVGHTQLNKQGFGYSTSLKPTTFRSQIKEKVRAGVEQSRFVKACQQPKQGRWTAWSESVQVR